MRVLSTSGVTRVRGETIGETDQWRLTIREAGQISNFCNDMLLHEYYMASNDTDETGSENPRTCDRRGRLG